MEFFYDLVVNNIQVDGDLLNIGEFFNRVFSQEIIEKKLDLSEKNSFLNNSMKVKT